jgi:hypothetical protein
MSRVASWPVRPRRPVRTHVPSVSGRRCGDALAAPAAREVEHLVGAGGQGQHGAQRPHVDGLTVGGGVGQLGLDDEHPVLVEAVAHAPRRARCRMPSRAPSRLWPPPSRVATHRGAVRPPARWTATAPACRASPRPRWAGRRRATGRRAGCAATGAPVRCARSAEHGIREVGAPVHDVRQGTALVLREDEGGTSTANDDQRSCSSLGRAEGEAGHELLLEHEEDDEHRQGDDDRARPRRGWCRRRTARAGCSGRS